MYVENLTGTTDVNTYPNNGWLKDRGGESEKIEIIRTMKRSQSKRRNNSALVQAWRSRAYAKMRDGMEDCPATRRM